MVRARKCISSDIVGKETGEQWGETVSLRWEICWEKRRGEAKKRKRNRRWTRSPSAASAGHVWGEGEGWRGLGQRQTVSDTKTPLGCQWPRVCLLWTASNCTRDGSSHFFPGYPFKKAWNRALPFHHEALTVGLFALRKGRRLSCDCLQVTDSCVRQSVAVSHRAAGPCSPHLQTLPWCSARAGI